MSPGVAERERCWSSLVAVLMAVVQEVAGSCCAASFVSRAMVAAVGRRVVAFALYQAQV